MLGQQQKQAAIQTDIDMDRGKESRAEEPAGQQEGERPSGSRARKRRSSDQTDVDMDAEITSQEEGAEAGGGAADANNGD